MSTLRTALLTLALFALLIATAFVRNAVAALGDGGSARVPVQTVLPARYFATTSALAGPQQTGDAARFGLLPSAAVDRQFTRQAASLRAQLGLSSMDPVPSAATFPTHAANRALSPEQAYAQAPRVAAARGLTTSMVLALVNQYTERFPFGGEAQVNLAMLNRALDDLE